MSNRILVFTGILLVMLPASLSFATGSASIPQALPLTGDEPVQNLSPAPIGPGLIADSPGLTIGTTQYDYQTNGSTGSRLVIDVLGGKHFAWMNALTYPSPRHIYYNYQDPAGNWLAPGVGVQVNDGTQAGYTTLATLSDRRAFVAYHQASLRQLTGAIDANPGTGVFSYVNPPDTLTNPLYWPYVDIDRNNRIHVVGSEQPLPQGVGYTRSIDGGLTWTPLQRIDTVMNISTIVVSSLVSDKVAIVYTHPLDLTYSQNNDIYYIMSEDGVTWDFDTGKVNVTDYAHAGTDLRAWDDLDAIFDYNDNLHILWSTGHFISGAYSYRSWLWHYNDVTGTINYVADQPDSIWSKSPGVFNQTIAKMSLGVGPANTLFAVWTQFDTTDASAGGYCNGELYMSYSTDATTWAAATDITNSHTPGCALGNCDSDHWSSLAEQVDTALHIIYINDKYAGGAPQNEGGATTNPVLYLAYPNPTFSGGAPELAIGPNPVEIILEQDQVGTIDITIASQGAAPLHYAFGENISWLTLPYIRGALLEGTADTVSFTFDATGFVPGNYSDQVTVNSNDPITPVFTLNVIMHVGAAPPQCEYVIGDVNNNGAFNGIDVTYAVGYFKGGPLPPYSCECTPGNTWYVAGDVNGNCIFNGIDVSYMVSYFKGGPAPIPCPDCPPGR